ncbi:hypothetical protein PUN28_013743 [Cardiocondyla obscurior]|uniref:Ribosomal protein S17 n=1 Tax=Cardiocondyla obscurior TaxID=286306 RepID=A0AAW2F5Y8_9HYME
MTSRLRNTTDSHSAIFLKRISYVRTCSSRKIIDEKTFQRIAPFFRTIISRRLEFVTCASFRQAKSKRMKSAIVKTSCWKKKIFVKRKKKEGVERKKR